MSEQSSLWNKDFLLDTGINFVVYLIYYLLMVIIAVVAKMSCMPRWAKPDWLREFLSLVRCWHDCSLAKRLNYTDANVPYTAAL